MVANSSDSDECEVENNSEENEDEADETSDSGGNLDETDDTSSSNEIADDFDITKENNRWNNDRQDWNNRIMFEASGLKVSDVLFLISAYTLRFLISEKGKEGLLELVKLFAGPEFQNARALTNSSFNSFNLSTNLVSYVFYCDICNEKLIAPVSKKDIPKEIQTCYLCEQQYSLKTDSENSFVLLDVEHQLRLLLENKAVQKAVIENIRRIDTKKLTNNNCIEDVHDGIMYRKVVPKESNVIHLTYNANTDGANIFNSSKRSLWPLQISINELPPSIRFKNIILAALWITSREPKPSGMQLYLSEFLEKTRRLREHGIKVTHYDTKEDFHVFKLHPICMCVDSVARPVIQNRLQYNGYFSCSWCYIRGIHSAGTVRYSITEDSVLRSHDAHLVDVRNSERTQRIVNGVKGPCVLSTLRNFDCVWGFPQDYLHGILLGVSRQLWNIWTNPGTSYYLSLADREHVNKRMEKIKPPLYVHRLIRLLTEKCKWKASE